MTVVPLNPLLLIQIQSQFDFVSVIRSKIPSSTSFENQSMENCLRRPFHWKSFLNVSLRLARSFGAFSRTAFTEKLKPQKWFSWQRATQASPVDRNWSFPSHQLARAQIHDRHTKVKKKRKIIKLERKENQIPHNFQDEKRKAWKSFYFCFRFLSHLSKPWFFVNPPSDFYLKSVKTICYIKSSLLLPSLSFYCAISIKH